MSTLFKSISRYYGRLHLGEPLGLNLRHLFEVFDFQVTKWASYVETFTYNHHRYHYFYHQYNQTFNNERIIEIPIIQKLYYQYPKSNILEIGNVLNHYGFTSHTVVDKYEKYPGVINLDVVEFKPQHLYDLILSISTLEHVGFDEAENPEKIHIALKRLRSLLSPKGLLIFTVPIGANPYLDGCIRENKLKLSDEHFLKRLNLKNRWVECTKIDALKHDYNAPYPFANAIMVGIYQTIAK